MPERIQRRRVKGWRVPEGARWVGRGSDWENPYVVGAMVMIETPSVFAARDVPGPRSDYCYGVEITPGIAVLLHRIWVADRLEEQIRAEMAGQDLVCWCALDAPCHADTYLEIANGPGHGADWSALRDACDEYSTAYMGEDDTFMPPALDKIRAALRGEDPYNSSWAGRSREDGAAAGTPNHGGGS